MFGIDLSYRKWVDEAFREVNGCLVNQNAEDGRIKLELKELREEVAVLRRTIEEHRAYGGSAWDSAGKP